MALVTVAADWSLTRSTAIPAWLRDGVPNPPPGDPVRPPGPGAAWFRGGWLHCKFLKPVPAMSMVEVGGAVTQSSQADSPDHAITDLDVWVKVNGTLATAGFASCGLNGGPEPG